MPLIIPAMQKLYIEGYYPRKLLACLWVDEISGFLSRTSDETPRVAGILEGTREDIGITAFCLTRCSMPGAHFLSYLNDDDTQRVAQLPYGARFRLKEFMENRDIALAKEAAYASVSTS